VAESFEPLEALKTLSFALHEFHVSMAHPLYVALIWHQHQPLYKSRVRAEDLFGGQYRMPWVRLHGTKDYLDLVLLLDRYPKLHQTVNLVPSLILQLEDYAAGTAIDPYLAATLLPESQLTPARKRFILERFFDANHATLIAPHPRYAELFQQRQAQGIEGCLESWSLQDYGDLLAWHNLAWIDPLFWDDPEIAAWLQQGRNFTLSDRQRIYSKQRKIISRILPQHHQMQAAGQLEITTSPYTHPILPLLADTNAGRIAIPAMTLPNHRFQWPEDIPRHLSKAWEIYCDRFGRPPRGLWPSEQSVSPTILSPIAGAGFEWICSDETVLGWSIKHFFNRDGAGNVYEPELLYRPYRLPTPQGDLAIVFRDHRLSDLIGFTYSALPPERAAQDLVNNLEGIAHLLRSRQASRQTSLEQPWLVTIALDGENCWEFYPQDGLPFLTALYDRLDCHNTLRLVTVSEFLDQFPASDTIPANQLHSGSWVDGSFSTWIGDPAKNRAWDLLTVARQTLADHPEATEETNPEAWEALFAAEGSDWCWWFGTGHTSNQDALFDRLFREHIGAIYAALNLPVPVEVRSSVEAHDNSGDRPPQSVIYPKIDGRGTEPAWEQAGRIEIGGARGTMHQSTPIQRLWYGTNDCHFYLRLDFQTGVQPGIDTPPELNLLWYYADRPLPNSPIPLTDLPDQDPLNHRFHHCLGLNLLTQTLWFQQASDPQQWQSCTSRAQIGLETCLEVAVPWSDLPTESEWSLRLLLVFSDRGRYRSYLPENSLVAIATP
jgi:alpha-amylase/alpha-mannosidase (GH57 family)